MMVVEDAEVFSVKVPAGARTPQISCPLTRQRSDLTTVSLTFFCSAIVHLCDRYNRNPLHFLAVSRRRVRHRQLHARSLLPGLNAQQTAGDRHRVRALHPPPLCLSWAML